MIIQPMTTLPTATAATHLSGVARLSHLGVIRATGPDAATFLQGQLTQDVVSLGESEQVEYLVKATDYLGVYPMHCHNAVHEDHGMMLLFAVGLVGDAKSAP